MALSLCIHPLFAIYPYYFVPIPFIFRALRPLYQNTCQDSVPPLPWRHESIPPDWLIRFRIFTQPSRCLARNLERRRVRSFWEWWLCLFAFTSRMPRSNDKKLRDWNIFLWIVWHWVYLIRSESCCRALRLARQRPLCLCNPCRQTRIRHLYRQGPDSFHEDFH